MVRRCASCAVLGGGRVEGNRPVAQRSKLHGDGVVGMHAVQGLGQPLGSLYHGFTSLVSRPPSHLPPRHTPPTCSSVTSSRAAAHESSPLVGSSSSSSAGQCTSACPMLSRRRSPPSHNNSKGGGRRLTSVGRPWL
jgi:hypothetical protein